MTNKTVKIHSSKSIFADVEHRCNKPIYGIDDRLYFDYRKISNRPKVILNTIPKSGTYLYSKLFEELGYYNTGIHLSSESVQDFRFETLESIVSDAERFRVFLPLYRSRNLLHSGQFSVVHLDCTEETVNLLSDMTLFFAIRDLRSVMVSFMRLFLDPRKKNNKSAKKYEGLHGSDLMLRFLEQEGGSYLTNRIGPIVPWVDNPNVEVLRFEHIAGISGKEPQLQSFNRIAARLEVNIPDEPGKFLKNKVLGQRTRTWTGSLSIYKEYWSDQVEEKFKELGGVNYNIRLGYQSDWH